MPGCTNPPSLKTAEESQIPGLVALGLSVKDIVRLLSGTGVDVATVRSECERLLGNDRVSLQRQTSIGLELLRDPPPQSVEGDSGGGDAFVARVVESLQTELDDPPDKFRDPVSYEIMNDPMNIETGHVFDRATIFDEDGAFRFETCPMTRKEIRPIAFPVVPLKKELVDFKLRRLDAVLECAGRLSPGNSQRALLSVAKAFLDQLGSGTYIHRAAAYWGLRLDSMGTN